jgi:membrane associated rhomboid family serine protease
VEQCHGMVNTMALFIIPGVGGTILSAIFLPQYISVGASGGIFGLIGGCIADIGLNWRLLFIQHVDETPKQVWRRNFFAVFILFFEILFNIVSRKIERCCWGHGLVVRSTKN